MRGGGMRVGGGEWRLRTVRGGAVLLARVPAHGLEGAQAGVTAACAVACPGSPAFQSAVLRAGRDDRATTAPRVYLEFLVRLRCRRQVPQNRIDGTGLSSVVFPVTG
jgi:hypothetical protein